MENAANALLIAAGVLIGVMILTLGVSLYTSLAQYAGDVQTNIVSSEVQKFNEQYVKYINYNQDTKEFTLTIHDIVTAASTAYENNLDDDYYVTINLQGYSSNLEKRINQETTKLLEEGLSFEYKCTINDVKINPNTGRVYEVNFSKI